MRLRIALSALAIVSIAATVAVVVRQTDRHNTAPSAACVYSSHSIAKLERFAQLVGGPVSCALVFNDVATTWDALVRPWFTEGNEVDHRWDRWAAADPARRLVVAQSLIPAGAPEDWRSRGAAGEYDAQFRKLATTLVAAGLGRSIIRLAHEANGTWFSHNIGADAAQWKDWAAYWARVARILHQAPGAHFELDLSVSAGPRAIPLAKWYPGDDAVDIVGIDQYDIAPAAAGIDQPARWTSQRTQPGGIDSIRAFAAAHGKSLSFPEWGVIAPTDRGAGDDAFYIKAMLTTFATAHARYDGYWDKEGSASELARNPASLAAYRTRPKTHLDKP